MRRVLTFLMLLVFISSARATETPDEIATEVIKSKSKVSGFRVIGIEGVHSPNGALLSKDQESSLLASDHAETILKEYMLERASEKIRICYALCVLSERIEHAKTTAEKEKVFQLQLLLGTRLEQIIKVGQSAVVNP